jgi:4-amino-4-deoxy-L-arabinose transferase-like glycosyltransferase
VTAQLPSPGQTVPFVAAGRRQGLSPTIIVAGLTLLAIVLRFYRVGEWAMSSDELFMLRDSITLRVTNPRPLLYFLNHYVVRPFTPLDELGLRLLPAFFGVLAIPAFYLVSRRVAGTRAALFSAFLVATSSLLVYDSQFGRYWSLVFLLSAVYPYVLYLGIRDGNGRLLALGMVTGLLAVLAHPVSVLPLGGLGVWVGAVYLKRDRLAELWSRRSVRWGVLLAGILAVVIALRFIPVLQSWVLEHDRISQRGGGGEFILHTPSGQGVKQLSLLLGYVESLTLPLVLTGLLGIYVLWQEGHRPLALLLACLFLFPIAFILLVQTRTSVSTFYISPATPALFIGAGVFLDRLAGLDWTLRPRWLLSALVAAMIFVAGAPTLVSQYRDGRRWDFRGVAHWLDGRLAPGDVVVSDQPVVMAYYLPGRDVRRLVADPARFIQAQTALQQAGRGGVLWIVSPAPSHAFRTNRKLQSLNGWMYDNCQLRNTVGVGRVDFRQNFLQVYRCPPAAPIAAGSSRQ